MAKLTKLDKRTLWITGSVFVISYIVMTLISGFFPFVQAGLLTFIAFFIQVFVCYRSQMVPCKRRNDYESQKYDPLHDWNNDYSVYRSATAHSESGFKSMDDHNRSSSIAIAYLHSSSNASSQSSYSSSEWNR